MSELVVMDATKYTSSWSRRATATTTTTRRYSGQMIGGRFVVVQDGNGRVARIVQNATGIASQGSQADR